MVQHQKDQYNFWLGLSESQRDYIKSQNTPVIVDVEIKTNVKRIQLEELHKLMSESKISAYEIIDDQYIQFMGIDGTTYLVFSKYDSATNQILPHSF